MDGGLHAGGFNIQLPHANVARHDPRGISDAFCAPNTKEPETDEFGDGAGFQGHETELQRDGTVQESASAIRLGDGAEAVMVPLK